MIRKPIKTLDQIEKEEEAVQESVVDKRTEEKRLEYKRGTDGLYTISFSAGGEVPNSLKGKFTSVRRVAEMIQQHEQLQQ